MGGVASDVFSKGSGRGCCRMGSEAWVDVEFLDGVVLVVLELALGSGIGGFQIAVEGILHDFVVGIQFLDGLWVVFTFLALFLV